MKEQHIPKFLKEEVSKYVSCVLKKYHLERWYHITPYMDNFIQMYNNIPKHYFTQAFTSNNTLLENTTFFARKWYRKYAYRFCTEQNINEYMSKYCPKYLR